MNSGNKRPSGKGRPAGGKGKPNSGFGDKKKSYGGSKSSGSRSSASGSGYGDKRRSYGEGGSSSGESRGRSSSSGGYGDKRRSYGEGGSSSGESRGRSTSSGGYGDKRRSYGEGGSSSGESRGRSTSSGGYGDKRRSYGEGGSSSGESRGRSTSSGGYGDKRRSYGESSSGSGESRGRSSSSGGYGDKRRSYGESSSGSGESRSRTRSYGEGASGESRGRSRSYGDGGSSGFGDRPKRFSRDTDDTRADFNEYKEPQEGEGERVPRKRTAASEDRQGRISSTPRADVRRAPRTGERFGNRERAPRDMREEEFEEEAPPERTRVGRYGSHSVTELPQLDQKDVDDEFIYGRNAVVAFLEGEQAQVNKIYIAKDTDPDRRLDKIVQLAKDLSIPTVVCDKLKLSTLIGDRDKHQGVVAQLAAGAFLEISEFLDWLDAQKAEYEAAEKSMDGFSLAILDGIEDPHNIGAIIRSADASGVKAVFLPQRRSAGLTATVAKVSAGALASMKVVRITNIVSTLEKLKDRGFWVVGMSLEGATDIFKSDLKRPLAIVIGSEGEGISRLVGEHCDMLVKIPMAGTVQSLNASVASGVVFYEVVRQNRQ